MKTIEFERISSKERKIKTTYQNNVDAMKKKTVQLKIHPMK